METTLFINAKIYVLNRSSFLGWLLIDGKRIFDFGEGEAPVTLTERAGKVIDAKGRNLLPGFIDIHTHGRLGVCTGDGDTEGQLRVARENAIHGVTAYLPTSMTDTTENILRAIRQNETLIGKRGDFAKIVGIHLEGPYFNPDRCGAQDTKHIRRASMDECRAFLDAGTIKRIAMAPEFEENLAAADLFRERNISVAAGHTTARYEDLKKGLEHGYDSITHLFNGMAAFGHRDPGTIGAALAMPEYSCELICDNIHSHPVAHKLAWLAKGRYGITLITDSIRPAGLPDGVYPMSTGDPVTVSHNGTEIRIPNGSLAGSALTMERALKNFTANVGASLDETWPVSSYNAAKAIRMEDETGSIEQGKLADLVLLDEDYQVMMTIVEGTAVYSAE